MKNQTIRNRYAALAGLSQSVLPSPSSINKVSTLLTRYFAGPYESTEISRKNALRMHPLPDGYEGDSIPHYIEERRQLAVDDLMENQGQPVKKIPDRLRLGPNDLPKVLKGEDGEDNTRGLAWIILNLGSLYLPPTESHPEDDVLEGEEEPFTPAEPTREESV